MNTSYRYSDIDMGNDLKTKQLPGRMPQQSFVWIKLKEIDGLSIVCFSITEIFKSAMVL
jgi:hypothetical protein